MISVLFSGQKFQKYYSITHKVPLIGLDRQQLAVLLLVLKRWERLLKPASFSSGLFRSTCCEFPVSALSLVALDRFLVVF